MDKVECCYADKETKIKCTNEATQMLEVSDPANTIATGLYPVCEPCIPKIKSVISQLISGLNFYQNPIEEYDRKVIWERKRS